jgi:hypothetical protein
MNERFQQILKQSTNPPWDGEQGPMNEFNLEKCFELIVEECARICDVVRESNGGDKSLGARFCADEIRAINRRS